MTVSSDNRPVSELNYAEVGDEYAWCVGVLQSSNGGPEWDRARRRMAELRGDTRFPS